MKAKRCCGVTRGPAEDSLAVAFLRDAARDASKDALALSEREFALLLAELVDLPCLDLSLQVELPKLLSPTVGRLREAIAVDDEIAGDAVIEQVLVELDTQHPTVTPRVGRQKVNESARETVRASVCEAVATG